MWLLDFLRDIFGINDKKEKDDAEESSEKDFRLDPRKRQSYARELPERQPESPRGVADIHDDVPNDLDYMEKLGLNTVTRPTDTLTNTSGFVNMRTGGLTKERAAKLTKQLEERRIGCINFEPYQEHGEYEIMAIMSTDRYFDQYAERQERARGEKVSREEAETLFLQECAQPKLAEFKRDTHDIIAPSDISFVDMDDAIEKRHDTLNPPQTLRPLLTQEKSDAELKQIREDLIVAGARAANPKEEEGELRPATYATRKDDINDLDYIETLGLNTVTRQMDTLTNSSGFVNMRTGGLTQEQNYLDLLKLKLYLFFLIYSKAISQASNLKNSKLTNAY